MALSYLITVLFLILIIPILFAAPAVTTDKVKNCWLILLVLLLCWPVQAIQKGGSGSNNGEKINGSLEVNSILVVTGTIETTSGGIKFPNGTVQLTASGGWIRGGGQVTLESSADKVGIGTKEPTAKLDIMGSAGYNQIRLRTDFTPTNSSDSRGNIGDIAWDDNYIYVKTSAGWKRAFISTWIL